MLETSWYYKHQGRQRTAPAAKRDPKGAGREAENSADVLEMQRIERELWTQLLRRARRIVKAVLSQEALAALARRKRLDSQLAYLLREDAWRTWLRACTAKVRLPGAACWLAQAQQLRNRCIERNLPLVYHFVRKAKPYGIVEADDLVNEGAIGLIRGVEAFDPRKGFTFGTYATWWIRHRITRCMIEKAHCIRIPVHTMEMYNRQEHARAALCVKLGREPTEAEVATVCCISEHRLADVRAAKRLQLYNSIDAAAYDEHESSVSLLDITEDCSAMQTYDAAEKAGSIQLHMQKICCEKDRRGVEILEARLRGETLQNIGDRYGITKERVRQLQVQIIRRLGRMIDGSTAVVAKTG